MVKKKIIQAFARLEKEIRNPLKLLVGGGGAMILAYGMPEGTQYIDAVTFKGFEKIEDLRPKIQKVAKELNLPSDWINPYFGNFAVVLPENYANRLRSVYLGNHLEVMVLGPEDLLIMKLSAGRPKDDVHIRRLLKTQKIDLAIVESHLENLLKKNFPQAQKILDRFDEYLEDLGMDG